MINGNVAMADGHNNTEEDMEDGEDHVHLYKQTQLQTLYSFAWRKYSKQWSQFNITVWMIFF